MAPVPDIPPALCQPAPAAKPAAKPASVPSGKAEEARQAAVDKYGETLFYRAGDDLFAFPARYALAPPELGLLGCLIRSRETAFAFPLSDMAAAMAAHAATPGVAPPRAAGTAEAAPAGDDPTIRVTAFHLGPHPDFAGMTKTIASVRREDKRQGFLNDLERFPAAGGDYLVRISEDRGVLARLPASPDAADARAQLWFQTPVWSAAVEVPANALPRWDTIHAAIDAFVAQHLVKGYFKR